MNIGREHPGGRGWSFYEAPDVRLSKPGLSSINGLHAQPRFRRRLLRRMIHLRPGHMIHLRPGHPTAPWKMTFWECAPEGVNCAIQSRGGGAFANGFRGWYPVDVV